MGCRYASVGRFDHEHLGFRQSMAFRVVHLLDLRGWRSGCAGGADSREVTQGVITRRHPVRKRKTTVLANLTEVARPPRVVSQAIVRTCGLRFQLRIDG